MTAIIAGTVVGYAMWNLFCCFHGCTQGHHLKRKYVTGQNNSCLINEDCCEEARKTAKPGIWTLAVGLECLICPCYYCGFCCGDPSAQTTVCHCNQETEPPSKSETPETMTMK